MTKKTQPAVVQNNIFGIFMMMLHAVALSVLYAVVKELTQELSSNLIVFLYKFMILVCALPWCLYGGIKTLKTHRIWLHMSRGFLSVCGSLSMFYAIKHIGLSDVTAVAYLEQIVLLIVGILYFKEKANKTKLAAIVVSFVGAVLIIKSEYFMNIYEASVGHTYSATGDFNSFYIFVFMAIAFWSMNSTVIKILGKTEKTKVQLFYVMLFSCIIAFPIAFMDWESVTKVGVIDIKYPVHLVEFASLGLTLKHVGYIFVLAVCYFLHVIGHFKAFKHAELSVVVPFEYTRLVFAGILGYIFFGEVALLPSYIGYILITIAGVFLFRAEHRKHRKKRAQELEEEFDQA